MNRFLLKDDTEREEVGDAVTIQRAVAHQKLQILFLTPWYPTPDDPVSGAFVRECAGAVSQRNEVVVIRVESVKGLSKLCEQREWNDGIRALQVRVRALPIPGAKLFLRLWFLFRLVKRLKAEGFRPDILHAHVYTAGVLAVLLGLLTRTPAVVTEHFTGYKRHLLTKLDVQVAKFAMRNAKAVMPVSADLEKDMRAYGISAEYEVVPNVVDVEAFRPKDRTGSLPIRLLTVCMLNEKKGVPFLLEAVAALGRSRSDFHLDIVGDGPLRDEYEKLASSLRISELVTFRGLLPKPQVAELMCDSHLFVLPSLVETFGVVYIEAMAAGLPIVATPVGLFADGMDDALGKLVKPGDAPGLTQALDWVMSHLPQYSSERISEVARSRYSYEAVGKRIEELYRRCL